MSVVGSGRTDAGVHAEGQVAHLRTTRPIEKYDLVRALNSNLPDSIGIQKAWLAPADFHAQQSAQSKTYRYQIHNSPIRDPLRARYSTWFWKPLDLNRLNALTECLVGTHDFKSFQTGGSEVKTTVRTLTEAHWHMIGPDWVEFRITGTGFLKQMVRNVVGTLIHLEQYAQGPEEMTAILQACDRQAAKTTAPAQGLHLHEVHYPPELDNRCREL
jgi:tRNA pseudouridine38-40 synthase